MAQLDVGALAEVLRHVPGFSAATRKWLQINPTRGHVEWQTPVLASTEISDFTEAAQDATGAMVATSSKVSLTYVDATPSLTADIVAGSLGPADIANRTRYFSLPIFSATARDGTPVIAMQGGNTRYRAWAFDAAGTESIACEFVVPTDYVSGGTLVLNWTNLGAGSGNVVWTLFAKATAAAGDLNTTVGEVSASDTIAAPAQNILKNSLASVAETYTPADIVPILIIRAGADAADTLGNDAGLVGVTFQYTADS